jgi:hypothetical protein
MKTAGERRRCGKKLRKRRGIYGKAEDRYGCQMTDVKWNGRKKKMQEGTTPEIGSQRMDQCPFVMLTAVELFEEFTVVLPKP